MLHGGILIHIFMIIPYNLYGKVLILTFTTTSHIAHPSLFTGALVATGQIFALDVLANALM